MTILDDDPKVEVLGNDSATTFSFSPIVIAVSTELVVTHVDADDVETVLVEGTGATKYAVVVTTYPGTGSIRYPEAGGTPVATGAKLVIKRVVPLTQLRELSTQAPYSPSVQEAALDKLTKMNIQQQEELDRAVKVPIGQSADVDLAALNAAIIDLAAIDAEIVIVSGISANVTTVAGISANVTTVSGISANVTTVAGISANVTTVAGISANVTTVAAIPAGEITTVAGVSASVTTVAGISANVTTVAGISANVTTVAGISANVTTVAGISASVTTVAGISADVTAVAAVDAEVVTVAGISANVTTVAGISANVTTVAGISANVTTVAGISANVTTVAGISANVTTVAGISASVTTVAGISADVTTVAGISADVTAVAGIAGDVTGVAAASAFKYLFDTSITMADPGSGDVRFNNATPASITQVAISATFSGGSDISASIVTWDDSTTTALRGTLTIRNGADAAQLMVLSVTGAITDNGTWLQIPVAHVSGSTLPASGNSLFLGFARTGDAGAGVGDLLAANNLSDVADIPTAFNTLAALDATPNTDLTANGPTTNTFVAGATITAGDLVYLSSASKWLAADADAVATSGSVPLAISLESKTLDQAMKVALPGCFIRNDAWAWTPAVPLYVSETAAGISASVPTGVDGVVRVIGYAKTADVIFFNPSDDYVTIDASGTIKNVTGIAPPAAAAGGIVLQAVSMTIAEASGTTNIPFDDTLPASTEGTEIGTQAITMADNTNKVLIHGAIQVSHTGTDQSPIVVVLFRGTTAISARAVGNTDTVTNSFVISFAVLDSPATAGAVTYSARIGHSNAAGTGTWLLGTSNTSDFGDVADDGLVLLEISA